MGSQQTKFENNLKMIIENFVNTFLQTLKFNFNYLRKFFKNHLQTWHIIFRI